MRRYTLDVAAKRDLREIYEHVRKDNPAAAGRLRELFMQKFRFLAEHPAAGDARDDLLPGIRLFTAGSYALIFRPAQGGVAIARVIHAARDWDAIVRGVRD